MGWVLKTVSSLVVAVVAGYAVLVVDFGGQTLASHAMDVWRSDIVQQKVARARVGVRNGVRDQLAERLAENRGEALSETDKAVLDRLLAAPPAEKP